MRISFKTLCKVLACLVACSAYSIDTNAQDYWQQELKYSIKVKLDDKKHTLDAYETIEYINNSPDELTYIYMHLWPNAYKDRSTALVKQKLENGEKNLYYASEERRGYIDGLDFKVDGEKVKWELDPEHIDICKLTLNKPLKSGGRIIISTPFHLKFPRGVYSRLGHIGESYQVTQWYPKPAVYDANGWHQMPYLDQGEFYSEYGTYDVFITLPQNYMVGATGDLIGGDQERNWLEMKVEETKEYLKNSEGLARNTTAVGIDELTFPPSASDTKTLHYRQSNVHDFGWFADKRWHVLKGEVELPHSKRKVYTWVMFTDEEAHLWKDGIEYMNDAVYYYSLWNGDYPYQHATAVDGALSAGGGMEYPNVTVIGTSGNAFALETVIMHEVGHNWFYGILGSNERDHPWMDEGLNSFNENRYIETKYPDRKLIGAQSNFLSGKFLDLESFDHKDSYYLGYLLNARRRLDQPIEFKSAEYSYINYGTVVYGKTALVFDYLMAYLGNDVMDNAMHAYFDTWKFKHPQPEDLRKILEEETGKDLSWFFDNLINGVALIDYKIVKAKNTGSEYTVTVRNVANTNVPFSISGIVDGKSTNTTWYEGFDKKTEVTFAAGDYDALKIDWSKDIPEVNRRNNTYKTAGLFKKVEPLRLQLLTSLENPNKTQIFWTPVIGWNEYDHAMPGLAVYNSVMPARRLEYVFMPLYSTSTQTVLGSAKLGYNWFPKGAPFQNIRLTVGGSRYSNGNNALPALGEGIYGKNPIQANKLKTELGFTLRNKSARTKVVNKLLLTSYDVWFTNSDVGDVIPTKSGAVSVNYFPEGNYYVKRLAFVHTNGRTLNPYDFTVSVEQGQVQSAEPFVKAQVEANYQVSYRRGRGLDIRLFSGRFLYNDFPNVEPKFAFAMHGNRDYLYDHVFLGRSETSGMLGAQFVRNDGGFKNPVDMANAYTWLTAVNFQTSTIPGIPLSVYADLGWSSSSAKELIVGVGVAIPVIPNILEVYFPIYTTTGIDAVYNNNIGFVFNIAALNPFELLKNIPH